MLKCKQYCKHTFTMYLNIPVKKQKSFITTAALKKVIISETTLLRFLVSLPHEHLVKHQPLIQKTLDENPFFEWFGLYPQK